MLPLSRSQLQRYRVDDRRRPTGIPRLNRDSPQAQEGLEVWLPAVIKSPIELAKNRTITYGSTASISLAGGQYSYSYNASTNDAVYVEFPPGLIANDGPFTIGCWFYIPGSTVAQSRFLALSDKDGTDDQHSIGIGTNRANFQVFADTVQDITISGALDFEGGPWAHLAAVFVSSTERHLYLNGVNIGTSTDSRVLTDDIDRLAIGVSADATPFGPGTFSIHDAALWSRAHSDSFMYNEVYLKPRDLYWRPRLMVPGFVAAAATADINQHTFETHRALLS